MIRLEFVPVAAEIALLRSMLEEPPRRTRRAPRSPRRTPNLSQRLAAIDLVYGNDLVMPVRFEVGDVELLTCSRDAHPSFAHLNDPNPPIRYQGHPPCPWLPVPLGAFAWELLNCARGDSCEWPCAVVSRRPGGVLQVAPAADGQLDVRSMLSGRTAMAVQPELVAAARAFADEVAVYLRAAMPELAQHHRYGPWIGGGADFIH